MLSGRGLEVKRIIRGGVSSITKSARGLRNDLKHREKRRYHREKQRFFTTEGIKHTESGSETLIVERVGRSHIRHLNGVKPFHAPTEELVRKWRIESHRDGSLARYARLLPPI